MGLLADGLGGSQADQASRDREATMRSLSSISQNSSSPDQGDPPQLPVQLPHIA